MGLDNFWSIGQLQFDPPLQLVGGLFSGNGNGSFRGKVYSDFIEDVTGVSLYQERIDNSVVKKMSEKLAEVTPEKAIEYDIPENELRDLQRMFATYAEAGSDLLGWW